MTDDPKYRPNDNEDFFKIIYELDQIIIKSKILEEIKLNSYKKLLAHLK